MNQVPPNASKRTLNVPEIHPRGHQNRPPNHSKVTFGLPWGRLGTQTGKGALNCTKLEPKGAPNGVIRAPWGTKTSITNVKNAFKKTDGIGTQKKSEKV